MLATSESIFLFPQFQEFLEISNFSFCIFIIYIKDHFHPFLDETTGNDFDLYPAPEPEDFFAATNSFLKVILYATDSDGLTTEVQRDVQPRTVEVGVQSRPEVFEIVVGGYAVLPPLKVTSWVNYNLPLKVEDHPPYIFKEWSDGNTSRSRTMKLSSTDENPTITAFFCIRTNATCYASARCCTGYCSANLLCEAPPNTPTPTNDQDGDFSVIPEVPDDENVETPPSILPGVGNPLDDDQSIVVQSGSDNGGDDSGDKFDTSEKWLLSCFILVVVCCPLCLGCFYCRLVRKYPLDPLAYEQPVDLESSGDESDERRQCLPSAFSSPVKSRSVVIEDPESVDAVPRTSYIWETLAAENERQAKIRARLSDSNLKSDTQFGTPETIADSPTSTNTGSSTRLSASIDETLVRLDDILSRTFQFSRSRKNDESNVEKSNGGDDGLAAARARSVESAYQDDDDDDDASDSPARILIPLGNSYYPDSPLREELVTKDADTSVYSYASGALEDGMNESAVHLLDSTVDRSSFFHAHSYAEESYLMDMSMPASMLNDTTADDDGDSSTDDEAANAFLQFHEAEQFLDNKENETSVYTSSDEKDTVNEEGSPTRTESSASTDDDTQDENEEEVSKKEDSLLPPNDISAETTLPRPVDSSGETTTGSYAEQPLLGRLELSHDGDNSNQQLLNITDDVFGAMGEEEKSSNQERHEEDDCDESKQHLLNITGDNAETSSSSTTTSTQGFGGMGENEESLNRLLDDDYDDGEEQVDTSTNTNNNTTLDESRSTSSSSGVVNSSSSDDNDEDDHNYYSVKSSHSLV